MKLGVMTVALQQKSVEETFKYLSGLGVQAVEIGSGGYPGMAHMNPSEYIDNPAKVEEYKALLNKYKLEICAFSTHSEHCHPNKAVADRAHTDFINTCKVAQLFDVKTVVTFSGCPGDSKQAQNPNWVTCAWPQHYLDILDYQWNQVLIPYWKEAVKIAKSYGVEKIALEMHPGFCVYNPETLLKLREAVGLEIGVNFDPSHLIWQGIQPAQAIKALKGAIYHFHAKDTKLDSGNMAINGVLDSKHYGDVLNRSWVFRTIGYGSDYAMWKDMMSALAAGGYDGVVSIEHEDSLMSIQEGLEKAITFLKDVMIFEKPGEIWWA